MNPFNKKKPAFPASQTPPQDKAMSPKKAMGMAGVLVAAGIGLYIAISQMAFVRGEKDIAWHDQVDSIYSSIGLYADLKDKRDAAHSPLALSYFNLGCKPMGASTCTFLPKQPGEEAKLDADERLFAAEHANFFEVGKGNMQ
jgi:hypothetical protein